MIKYLILALALLGLGPAQAQWIGPPNAVMCNNLANVQAPPAAPGTQIIAGIAGKTTYLCGWHVTNGSGTSQNFSFTTNTGGSCGGTVTTIIGPFSTTTTSPSIDHSTYASLSVPPGVNVCVVGGATAIQAGIWFSQY